MSVKYVPVQWNANKWLYDAILILLVLAYLIAFLEFGATETGHPRQTSGATLRMRAFGSCAFFMLSIILAIGPLARIDQRFLPLLYNRRHYGVLTFAVAITHFLYVMSWYGNFLPDNSWPNRIETLFSANGATWQLLGFPIELWGGFALLCLAILALTSHDFWLSFLGAPVWKRLHLLIYPAYAAVIAHVAFGYAQDGDNTIFVAAFAFTGLAVAGLHLVAWLRERSSSASGSWISVCAPEEIPDKRARIVALGKEERVAIFRDGNKISAVSNACAHQNGPLGEGRIVYGCITCPWHGFQYRMEDGRSPAPFTEKIPTYRVRLGKSGMVEVEAKAQPPGTALKPLIVELEGGK